MDIKQIYISILFFIFLLFQTSFAYKLFVITLSDNYGKLRKEKIFYLGNSEPSFGIIHDLKPPKKFFLLTPNHDKIKLTLLRTEYEDQSLNIKRIGYQTKIIPEHKGDYYLCIEGDFVLDREGKLLKHFSKTPFHVEIEKGWDNLCDFDLEIKPQTRPYGFREHSIFWGQVWYKNKPLETGIVEVEKFSPSFIPYEDLPKDSYGEINYPYLKKTVKISKNGFFVVSFEEPGWWLITIRKKSGAKYYGNTLYPVELVSHLWIYVYPSKNIK